MPAKSKYEKYFQILGKTAKCLEKNCAYSYSSKSSTFPKNCLRAHFQRYHVHLYASLLKNEAEVEIANKSATEKQKTDTISGGEH